MWPQSDLSPTVDDRRLRGVCPDAKTSKLKMKTHTHTHGKKLNRSELSAGGNTSSLQRTEGNSKSGNQGNYCTFFMSFH